MTALRDAALAYATAGYQVFRLRGKLPHANWPACEPRSRHYRPHHAADCTCELCHGLYAATSDPAWVARWWSFPLGLGVGEAADLRHRRHRRFPVVQMHS